MNIEIPEFLLELSNQMNENENRSTSFPFWQVRQKDYLITAEGYNEHHWEIVDEDGNCLYHSEESEDYSQLADSLLEYSVGWCVTWLSNYDEDVDFDDENFVENFSCGFNPDYEDLPEPYSKHHLQEVEKVLTTHLTKEDAEWFIARKSHDLHKPYTYVESAYWSPQFKELQDWIRALTGGKSGA